MQQQFQSILKQYQQKQYQKKNSIMERFYNFNKLFTILALLCVVLFIIALLIPSAICAGVSFGGCFMFSMMAMLDYNDYN